MQDVKELQRRPSPGGRPQPLAYDGTSLWTGSWDTDQIYEINPADGKTLQAIAAPGKPYGLATLGLELRVVVSIGDDDDRYFYTLNPKTGFDPESKTPCPDLTGSHLASGGSRLYLAQMHNQRILVMTPQGTIEREIALPSRIGGMCAQGETLYVIAADEEFENLHFAAMDLKPAEPEISKIASIPFGARSLAFDGAHWWTCDREAGQIVSFSV